MLFPEAFSKKTCSVRIFIIIYGKKNANKNDLAIVKSKEEFHTASERLLKVETENASLNRNSRAAARSPSNDGDESIPCQARKSAKRPDCNQPGFSCAPGANGRKRYVSFDEVHT